MVIFPVSTFARIFEIDDDSQVGIFLHEILELAGHTVITATAGALGLNLCERKQPELGNCISHQDGHGWSFRSSLPQTGTSGFADDDHFRWIPQLPCNGPDERGPYRTRRCLDVKSFWLLNAVEHCRPPIGGNKEGIDF